MSEELREQGQVEEVKASEAERTYTEEEMRERIQKAVQDRLARERKKYEGFEEMRKELEELRKFREEQKLAQMSELEKLQHQLEQERQEKENYLNQFSQLQEQLKQEKLYSQFREVARSKGIQYVDDALKLSDLSKVELGENGEFVGIDEVVDQLIESKPFLLAQQQVTQPKPIGNPSNPPAQPEKSQEEQLREAAERYKKSQRPEDYVYYINLKRKFGR